jgi:hypothetical protein
MADDNKHTPPVVTDDDLYNDSADEINAKIETVYAKRLAEAIENYKKEHPEPPAPQTAPEDILKEFDCFGSPDEDIREAAESMLERELAKLPDGAGPAKVREACDKVAKRIAKLAASKDEDKDKKPNEGAPYDKGPVPSGGGGAAAAHINATPPGSIDEAYELSAKIAESWGKK